MKPGIYYGMRFEEYRRIDAVNFSALKWCAHTVSHMRAYMDGLIKYESGDLAFGRAVHTAILEPDVFASEYKIAGNCNAVTNGGTQCGNRSKLVGPDGEWYCAVRGHAPNGSEEPDEFVTEDDKVRIDGIVSSLRSADCLKLLRGKGWSEAVVVWECGGVLCKGRLDRLTENHDAIIDLKKVQMGRADKDSCQKSIVDYLYHMQAGMYVDAVASITGTRPEFVWVFVEDKPPHEINLIKADSETLAIGKFDALQSIDKWNRAKRTDRYPGHVISSSYISEGGLPGWKRREYENFIIEH